MCTGGLPFRIDAPSAPVVNMIEGTRSCACRTIAWSSYCESADGLLSFISTVVLFLCYQHLNTKFPQIVIPIPHRKLLLYLVLHHKRQPLTLLKPGRLQSHIIRRRFKVM